MAQLTNGDIEPGIKLVIGNTKSMPCLWLTDEPGSEFQEERKKITLQHRICQVYEYT